MPDYSDIIERLTVAGAPKMLVPKSVRFNTLFYPYRFLVYNISGEAAQIGNGSFSVIKRWEYFGDSENAIEAGNYIDCARVCSILTGGEHPQNKVFNICTQFLRPYGNNRPQSRGAIKIGHGVTISHGAMIRSGVSVGNGAVIGMGAIVTDDVPPFAIVAGNPARIIRYRFEPHQIDNITRSGWWDLKPSYIMKNLDIINRLSEKSIDFPKEAYFDKETKIVLKIDKAGESIKIDLLGTLRGQEKTQKNKLPRLFQFYYNQLDLPDDELIYVLEDVFNY